MQTPMNEAIYDVEEAIDYITDRSGHSRLLVSQVLDAQARYQVLLGVCGPDAIDDGSFDLEKERTEHRDLLPEKIGPIPFCDWSNEGEYIQRCTGLPASILTEILTGEMAFSVRLGVTGPAALEDYRQWVVEWSCQAGNPLSH